MANLDLSIIIPMYNEEGNVPSLLSEIKASLDGIGKSYEILLVDDGSTDGTPGLLRAASAADPRVKSLFLARNFGQTAAMAAGFEHAGGRVFVTLDADLQNDPTEIPRLLDSLEEGNDIVSGWRRDRQDPALSRRLPSHVANRLISVITGVHLHDYGCTLKAYRREVLSDVHLYGEMHRFLPAIASWGGWRIKEIPVRHRPRHSGTSKYGLARTLKVLLDLATVKFLGSYSTKPIYVFGTLGIVSIASALLTVLLLLYRKWAHNEFLLQSPLLLLSVLLVVLGAQSICLGLLAEMMVRTYYEAQRKPIYRLREALNLDPGAR